MHLTLASTPSPHDFRRRGCIACAFSWTGNGRSVCRDSNNPRAETCWISVMRPCIPLRPEPFGSHLCFATSPKQTKLDLRGFRHNLLQPTIQPNPFQEKTRTPKWAHRNCMPKPAMSIMSCFCIRLPGSESQRLNPTSAETVHNTTSSSNSGVS